MPSLLTQSLIRDFRNCRKLYELRFERSLVPLQDAYELGFGQLVHDGLQHWYTHHDIDKLAEFLAEKAVDPTMLPPAWAALRGYAARYATEDFTIVELEREFRLPLRDKTGAVSGDWIRGGKIDGIVRRKNGLWLMEHKTASRIDAAYLSRLWLDFQITWYSPAVEELHGEPVVGVIYNVIQKLGRGEAVAKVGETDAEFQERYDAAKNKKLLKRRMGEDKSQYRDRLNAAYADPTMFHREEILLDRADISLVLQEASDIATDIDTARANGHWYRNTDQCFKWNKPCQYLPVCQSRENPLVIENQYLKRAPHTELELSKEAPAF
jgi:hypothetical protein